MDDDSDEIIVKQPKRNFEHYENIIDDPKRVTSWTNVHGKQEASEPSVLGKSRFDLPHYRFFRSFVFYSCMQF